MKIQEDIVKHIANIFFHFYKTDEEKDIAMKVLKILDFSYDKKARELTYNGSLVLLYREDDYINLPIPNYTMPLDLNTFDRECIEEAINLPSVVPYAITLSPLFDCIGWLIKLDVDTYRLHFMGSCSYELWKEVWKEPMMRWDDDLEDDACDWKSGDDWRDGMNLENMKFPPDWKKDIDNNPYI